MQSGLKERFTERWNKYFPGADLPIAFFYTDDARITSYNVCYTKLLRDRRVPAGHNRHREVPGHD